MASHLYPSLHHVTCDIESLGHDAAFSRFRLSAFPPQGQDVVAELLVPVCDGQVTRLLNEQALHLRRVATELLEE